MTDLSTIPSRRCPGCGAGVPEGSSACPSCRVPLRGEATARAISAAPITAVEPGYSVRKSTRVRAFGLSFDPSMAALGVVAFSTVYLLLFVAPVEISRHPLIRLLAVALATTVATTGLLFIDLDESSEFDESPGPGLLTPSQWLGAVACLWPVAFPAYFWARARAVRPDRTVVAAAVTGIYLLTLVTLAIAFATASTETGPPPPAAGGVGLINGQTVTPPKSGILLVIPDTS